MGGSQPLGLHALEELGEGNLQSPGEMHESAEAGGDGSQLDGTYELAIVVRMSEFLASHAPLLPEPLQPCAQADASPCGLGDPVLVLARHTAILSKPDPGCPVGRKAPRIPSKSLRPCPLGRGPHYFPP